jgi:hypothetical protein
MASRSESSAATTAWLIERGQPENQNPPSYWLGGRWDDFEGNWTLDANEAARFASEQEAQAAFTESNPSGTPGRVVEHGWFKDDSPPFSKHGWIGFRGVDADA